jgi:FixJ family two-component response regulator
MVDARSVVVIIDDDPNIQEALTGLLETVGVRAIVCASADEFFKSGRPDGPCCVVLDIRLPGLGGLEIQRQLTQEKVAIPIIFITGYGDIQMSVQAMKAGAVEFLTKPIRPQEFLEAVQAALTQDHQRLERNRELHKIREHHHSLTPRERQVMTLLVAGRVNKQIAGELGVSEVTVRLHRLQVMRKMQAASLADLLRIAFQLKEP